VPAAAAQALVHEVTALMQPALMCGHPGAVVDAESDDLTTVAAAAA
jgi:hypothetical protein